MVFIGPGLGVVVFVDVGATAVYLIPTTDSCDGIDIVNFIVLDPVHAICYAVISIWHMLICFVLCFLFFLLFDLILSTYGLLLT